MLNFIAIIVALVGAAGFLLSFTGFIEIVQPVANVSIGVWAGVFLVGFVMWMMTRRPSN